MKDKMPAELCSHACLLPGGAVSFIAITKGVAESLAKSAYPNGKYRIVKARPEYYFELRDEQHE